MKQLYSNCPPNAFMQCFRPSTNHFTFLPSSPAPDLSSNFTEKNFKSKVQGTQSLHIRNVSDPQLQILHFWSPSRSPTSSKLECREKCKLLGPRHLITADLQWFGPPTNDFTFFRPSSQQGLTGIVTLYKASTPGFSLDNASTRIS